MFGKNSVKCSDERGLEKSLVEIVSCLLCCDWNRGVVFLQTALKSPLRTNSASEIKKKNKKNNT